MLDNLSNDDLLILFFATWTLFWVGGSVFLAKVFNWE